ncbi:MAG: DUF2807 domain-containing protein [Mongoliibacter sp.]|uniref:GIN domain-containing protein n=1 Tax=Mongoliibacter sp. TaxID=2022438 RepID=UPI0012F4568C|nr:DUF2807 domain-containing protein [Mongoliibacter sp.]TVP53231.1 MAG: DUF2807 domain-containing protein [Mongoliibacter sp.]
MKNYSLFLSLFLLLILCSCDSRDNDNAEKETKSFDIEGVSRLKVDGIFNLHIKQGDMESLTIEGSPEMIDLLTVRQRGDLLELNISEKDSRTFNKKGTKVNLTVADLSEMEFEGAGNITTVGNLDLADFRLIGRGVGKVHMELEADYLEADLNFVGSLTLKGAAREFSLLNEGIGNIDASKLISQKVDLISSGIGKVAVHCEDELSLEVNGIGTVSYTGNPTVVHENIQGIGKVNRN